MNRPMLQRAGSALLDAVSPGAVSYILVLLPRNALFLRAKGRATQILHVQPLDESPIQAIASAAEELAHSPHYYGQPVSIYVDNTASYFVSTRLSASNPKKDSDELLSLVPQNLNIQVSVQDDPHGKLLIVAGIDWEFCTSLTNRFSRCGVAIRSCLPLALLCQNFLKRDEPPPALRVIGWGIGKFSYSGKDVLGRPFAGYWESTVLSSHSSERASELATRIFGTDAQVTPTVLTLGTRTKDSSSVRSTLGHLLAPKSFKPYRSFALPSSVKWQLGTVMSTVQNSAKLLTHVLALITLFLIAIALASGFVTTDTSTSLESYQSLYTQQSILEHQKDSIQHLLDKVSRDPRSPDDPAALMSVFCQSPVSAFSLTSIAVRTLAKDTVSVEAVGNARSANTIFEYTKGVNAQIAPRQLGLASFQPEIQQTASGPDTTLRFHLGLLITHGK